MAQLQRFGGGAFGAGGTIAIRETLDEPSDSRWTQPSVLFGLGTGALATGLWYTNKTRRFETPVLGEEFWGAHALTSIPSGLLYAALPPEPGTGTLTQLWNEITGAVGIGGGNGGTGSNGGNGTNGGSNGGAENVTVRRANPGRTQRSRNGMTRQR